MPLQAEAACADAQLSRFVEQVDRGFRRDALESFWDLEAEFRRFIDSGCLGELLNRELEKLTANPSYMGDWRPKQLVLHRGRGFALSIGLFDQAREYIHTTPFFGMYVPIGTESLRYDLYRLPADYRNDVFDAALRLESAGSGTCEPGEVLRLQADRYTYDFKIERPVAVVKFTTAAFQNLEWLFDKDQLQARQANDSELNWTQLRVAAYILGRLAQQTSLEPLELLSTHPHHAVRWAAIQNLGRLSRGAALDKLESALDDVHPHVRQAAARTLNQVRQQTPE
ncbi:MAG: repeat protein [Nevskia sp.]|nr:repeat protein [Nevskia sp.]